MLLIFIIYFYGEIIQLKKERIYIQIDNSYSVIYIVIHVTEPSVVIVVMVMLTSLKLSSPSRFVVMAFPVSLIYSVRLR